MNLLTTDEHRKGWLSGQSFLYQNEQKWYSKVIEQLNENDTEIKQSETFVALNTVQSWLIGIHRYSTWSKLITMMSWL